MPRMPRQSPRTLAQIQRNRPRSNLRGNDERRFGMRFDKEINDLLYSDCNACKTRSLRSSSREACPVCRSQVRRELFAPQNQMDPGEVPDVLKALKPIEELLIAKIHPVITYFKIKGGQTGYRGNVINFRQNITQLFTNLPPTRDELAKIIVGVREGNEPVAFLTVRPSIIREALIWLKQNHQYYSDITINEDVISDLERDPNLSCLLETNEVQMDESEGIRQSYYPLIDPVAQDNQIQAGLQGHIYWPEQERSPINEFRTEGYITQAFPVLFPYGNADLIAPRQKKVNANDYFKYLMLYKDERFAKHNRFRFFAMNSILRWQALSKATILIAKNDFRNASVEEVSRRLLEDPSLRTSVMSFTAQLRSTTPYWKQRAGELLDMVNQLGPPTIFFTLSAADYHWNKLFELICPGRPIESISDAERRTLMHQNPMITSQFFKTRIEIYRKTVLKTFLNVKDSWMRYEWQFRGSPHVHGLLWLEGAPDLTNIDSMTEDDERSALDFCSNLTKAVNPNPDVTINSHPCRKTYTEVDDKFEDLACILNTVQRHTRHGAHCLRRKRGTNQQECRFKFPQPLADEDHFENVNGIYKFVPKRNDSSMNRYNNYIIQTWRANIDFNIITSVELVLNYIAKYVTKGELASVDFNELVEKISRDLGENSPGTSLLRKVIQASLSGRDYSAQEVCHVLMGWPLFESTRTFVNLNISERVLVRLGDPNADVDEVPGSRAATKLIQFYRNRPLDQKISLFDYAKSYVVVAGSLRQREKTPIIRPFPRFKKSLDPVKNEDYCKQQVQLYFPWWESPLTIKDTDVAGGPYQTWAEAYNNLLPEALADIDFGPPDDDYEDIQNDDEAERNLEMALARYRQNLPEPRPLGDRLIDHQVSWDAPRQHDYSEDAIRDFLYNVRRTDINRREIQVEQPPTHEQAIILDLCASQIQSILSGTVHENKRVLIQGKAGTGKSFIIKKMVSIITERLGIPEAVQVLAPTGVAATNINGSTYHSFLRIQRNFKNLSNAALRSFQLQIEKVKFLIFDEVSMIGLKSMHYIQTRCQEATGSSEPFGGLFVYFFGDLKQLPPVKDSPVYNKVNYHQTAILGKLAFSTINRTYLLSTSVRQMGDDQLSFRNLLDEIALGRISDGNYELLMTRRFSNLTLEEKNTFRDAMYLFATNTLVEERNAEYLRSTGFPVAIIKAEHNCDTAKRGSDCQASCLQAKLHISRNSRVMLRRNLWIEAGLVNGSLGTVTDIIYEEGRRPPSLPKVIMVKFDKYRGRSYDETSYPITPVDSKWTDNGIDCSRKQFPLNLAFAITIHKAQGLTLDKAVIDIGPREISAGISYVAFSRVRKLQDLAIIQSFPKERLNKIQESKTVKDRIEYMETANII